MDLSKNSKRFSEKIKNPVFVEWAKTFRRAGTAKAYLTAIIRFCDYYDVTPEQLTKMTLEEIEEHTEKYIFENKSKLSPSFLNITYSSIKKFCVLYWIVSLSLHKFLKETLQNKPRSVRK